MSEFAKFSATLGKMTVGDTETKIELVLSMKEVQKNFMFLTNNQKQQVLVSLGDPQVSMQFPANQEEPYRVYRADQHGVVEPMDKLQGDLLDPMEESPFDPYQGKEIIITHREGVDEDVVEYIFEIVNGNALLPKKYENGEFIGTMSHEGVIEALGLSIAPLEDHAGIRYSVEQLLNEFDGALYDIGDEPDYTGKEIVVHIPGENGESDSVDYVFQIVDGKATYPIKYEFDKASVGMREQEVIDEIGLAPISKEGEPTRYLISDLLLMFNGVVRDKALTTVPGPIITEENLDDWEREIMGENDEALINEIDAKHNEQPAEPIDIDTYILTNKPVIEGIEYDFPTLLQRKKSGETWMDLAKDLGVPSTQLSTAWSKYKKQVEKMLGDNGAA
jgi:uncharacterized protein (DUF433 family)